MIVFRSLAVLRAASSSMFSAAVTIFVVVGVVDVATVAVAVAVTVDVTVADVIEL